MRYGWQACCRQGSTPAAARRERQEGENGKRYRRGDIWASVGAWFSGRWWNGAARGYVRQVKRHLAQRTWRTSDFRG